MAARHCKTVTSALQPAGRPGATTPPPECCLAAERLARGSRAGVPGVNSLALSRCRLVDAPRWASRQERWRWPTRSPTRQRPVGGTLRAMPFTTDDLRSDRPRERDRDRDPRPSGDDPPHDHLGRSSTATTVFVRSYRGATARWYREALVEPMTVAAPRRWAPPGAPPPYMPRDARDSIAPRPHPASSASTNNDPGNPVDGPRRGPRHARSDSEPGTIRCCRSSARRRNAPID